MARRGPRSGWLDTLRDAADLALLGILTTVGALGVVTLGAAVATASGALHHWQQHGYWPTARDIVHRYGRSLLPGVPVTLLAAAGAGLLGLNLVLFRNGTVPGGAALYYLTLTLAVALTGYAALVVVEVGRDWTAPDGTASGGAARMGAGWRAAARRAAGGAARRPLAIPALAGVTMLAVVLAGMVIPVTTPLLLGYLLFAHHVVTRRLLPAPVVVSAPPTPPAPPTSIKA